MDYLQLRILTTAKDPINARRDFSINRSVDDKNPSNPSIHASIFVVERILPDKVRLLLRLTVHITHVRVHG